MKKVKYYYNTHTLRYEKLETPFEIRLLRIIGFLASIVVTSIIIVAIAFQFIDSPKEILLEQQNEALSENYGVLKQRIQQLETQMQDLEKRDNDVYRSIFEAPPIPDSVRLKKMQESKELNLLQTMNDNQLITGLSTQLNRLSMLVSFQYTSLREIEGMIKNKEKLMSAIPAIQPVSNKNLNHIASGFGYRIDPIYKISKFHAGLDFAAPQGTPIYATADGRIKLAEYNAGGYGNHVIINHGFGYETLYGHMIRIKAKVGQSVKRGEVIGYVGSTGKSTGPHCHYEVHKDGQPVDPVYYFYDDLTPEQYDQLLKLAAQSNQSFD